MNRAIWLLVSLGLLTSCQETTRVVRDDSASTRFVNLFTRGRPGTSDGSGQFLVQRGGEQPRRPAPRDPGHEVSSDFWKGFGISTSFQVDQPATQPAADQSPPPMQATPWSVVPRAPGGK